MPPTKSTQAWLNKAAEDEQVVSLIKGAGGPYDIAAYHIQQAAEKYVKAALVQANINPPKIRDIDELMRLHPSYAPTPQLESVARMTTSYAAATRYPGGKSFSASDLTDAEADLAILKAWAVANI